MCDHCGEQRLDPSPCGGPQTKVPGPRTEEAGPLVLELVIAGTDPMRGTVGRRGHGSPIAFQGWIDLMSAINSLGA